MHSTASVLTVEPEWHSDGVDMYLHTTVRFLRDIGVSTQVLASTVRERPQVLEGALQAAVEYLWSIGMNAAEISSILSSLTSALDESMLPKLAYLHSIGVKSLPPLQQLDRLSVDGHLRLTVQFLTDDVGVRHGDIAALISGYPQVLSLPLETQLRPALQHLRDLGLTCLAVRRMLTEYPAILAVDVPRMVAHLQVQLGVGEKQVGKLVADFPACLLLGTQVNLRPQLEYLAGLTASQQPASLVLRLPQLLTWSVETHLVPQVTFLCGLGLTKGEVGDLVQAHPLLLNAALRPQLEYLIGLGVAPRQFAFVIQHFPQVLGYASDGKVRPLPHFLVSLGVKPELLGKLIKPYQPVLGHTGVTRTAAMLRNMRFGPGTSSVPMQAVEGMVLKGGVLNMGATTSHLQPAVRFLRSVAVPWKEIAAMASQCPQVLEARVRATLLPTIDFLFNAGLTPEDVGKLLRWHPRLLSLGTERLQQAADNLRALGIGTYHVGRVIRSAPHVCEAPVHKLAANLEYLQSLALSAEAVHSMVVRHPTLLTLQLAHLQRSVACMQAWGLTQDTIAAMLQRCPLLLTMPLHSPRYGLKLQFLREVLHHDVAAFLRMHPVFLIYSLPNRTGPRTAYLMRAGRRLEDLVETLSATDAKFCQEIAVCTLEQYHAFKEQWVRTEGARWGGK
ncbi:hypothetical protein WJX72_001677 [[Myrmecia] bisecta]|uniref:Uncharacterized protein n=1 Tax=[Myrmecia] bisecta TaxID=41462 RepID=A0AAW1R5E9_9CHLO